MVTNDWCISFTEVKDCVYKLMRVVLSITDNMCIKRNEPVREKTNNVGSVQV